MNWVQSALNGCVPILRVLGFPDMCLYPTRHTRTSGSPFPYAPDLSSPCQNTEAYPATCSQSTCFSKETPAERGGTCPFLPLLDVSGSLVPNSFVTLCGVNMKWPIGSWVEGLIPLWWLFWKVAESLGGTRPKGWGFLWSVPCPWLLPPATCRFLATARWAILLCSCSHLPAQSLCRPTDHELIPLSPSIFLLPCPFSLGICHEYCFTYLSLWALLVPCSA